MKFLLALALCLSAAAGDFASELRQGLIALQNNNLPLARQTLEHASTLNPDSAFVWAALAQTYLRDNERTRAVEAADRAAKLGAGDPSMQHALALFWSEAGDAQQTIAWATADLKQRDTADAHHLLADAYKAANQPRLATEQYRAAAERAPGNESYAFDLGQAQLKSGDFNGAMATLGKARTAFPHSAQIELGWGVAAYGQRRFTEAIDSFLRVIAIDPAIEQPYVFLAQILDQAGDRMPRILAAYEAWEKIAPASPLPWCLHAKALAATGGDAAQIQTELRRSIELNPGFWQSHYELGLLLAKQREWQTAASELARSLELNPGNANAHFQLARVYERLGLREQARAERAEHQRLTSAETGSALP